MRIPRFLIAGLLVSLMVLTSGCTTKSNSTANNADAKPETAQQAEEAPQEGAATDSATADSNTQAGAQGTGPDIELHAPDHALLGEDADLGENPDIGGAADTSANNTGSSDDDLQLQLGGAFGSGGGQPNRGLHLNLGQ